MTLFIVLCISGVKSPDDDIVYCVCVLQLLRVLLMTLFIVSVYCSC